MIIKFDRKFITDIFLAILLTIILVNMVLMMGAAYERERIVVQIQELIEKVQDQRIVEVPVLYDYMEEAE